MFRSSSSRQSQGGSNPQDVLGQRLERLEVDVEARLGALSDADTSLQERVRTLEVALKALQEGTTNFQEDIVSRIEEVTRSQEAEESKRYEISESLSQVSDAVASLAQECSICASNSRVDGLQEELAELGRNLASGSTPPDPHAADQSSQAHLQFFQERLAAQGSQLDRLREAFCGNGEQLRIFMDEETLRRNNLRVEGATAEWLVRDVETWLDTLPRGKFLESPAFSIEAPGAGSLDSLRFRFFPNGGQNVSSDGTCSLYLAHPSAMPWAQYELMVGRTRRGTFDPIFAGSDDFCPLTPELYPLDGVKVVRLCVRFLPLNRLQPNLGDATAGSPGTAAGPVAPSLAPEASGLWLSSNRLEAA